MIRKSTKTSEKQFKIQDKLFAVLRLTMAGSLNFFIPCTADTPSKRNKPISISSTVEFRSIPLFSTLHTWTPHFNQRWRINPWDGIRKHSQVPHSEGAFFVENTDRDQGNACPNVLKSQIKSFPFYGPHLTNFSVELKDAITQIHLSKALISSNCVDLYILAWLEFSPMGLIRFYIIQIECFFTSSQDPWDAVTISQCELHLHVNFLCSITRDPISPKPVVLVWFHDIAYLVCMYGPVVLIHFSNGIPLHKEKDK